MEIIMWIVWFLMRWGYAWMLFYFMNGGTLFNGILCMIILIIIVYHPVVMESFAEKTN